MFISLENINIRLTIRLPLSKLGWEAKFFTHRPPPRNGKGKNNTKSGFFQRKPEPGWLKG